MAGRGRPVLLAADFDGTLCPIANSPAAVRVPEENLHLLHELATSGGATIAVISGRALEDVTARLQGFPATFAGNHGLEIRGPGMDYRHGEASELQQLLTELCAALEEAVRPWRGAWVENKRLTGTVHFRNVAERDQHAVVLAVRAAMSPFGSRFGLRAGKKALEMHPRVEWNKGTALVYIRERLQPPPSGCICIGDDRTDESMFSAAAAGDITVRVGEPQPTCAAYHLASSADVPVLLRELLTAIREQNGGSRSVAGA